MIEPFSEEDYEKMNGYLRRKNVEFYTFDQKNRETVEDGIKGEIDTILEGTRYRR